MKKIKITKIVFLLFLLFFSNSVFSATAGPSVGTFTCLECPLAGPALDPETAYFIRTVVNLQVETWQAPDGQLKSVTICNDSTCATYQYTGGGHFQQVWVKPIINGGGGGGGGGAGSYVIVGYRPIYQWVTSCVGSYCETGSFLIGFEPVFYRTGTQAF